MTTPPKTFQHFRDLRLEAFRLYEAGDFAAALGLLNANRERFPDEAGILANWRMCMAALDGQKDLALKIFAESLDQGDWWNEKMMREDPDLASLVGDAEFERLMQRSAELEAQATANAKPERLTLAPPEDAPAPYPLLLFFHGRSSANSQFVEFWKDLPAQGWVVALAQSSQPMGAGTFHWDDTEKAIGEAREHFSALIAEYPIDPQRVVVAGFSQGGGLAIRLALTQTLPAQGCLGIAPFLRDFETVEQQMEGKTAKGVRVYLVTGELEQERETFTRIEALLAKYGAAFEREDHPNLAHEFPPDFEATLKKALPWLTERK